MANIKTRNNTFINSNGNVVRLRNGVNSNKEYDSDVENNKKENNTKIVNNKKDNINNIVRDEPLTFNSHSKRNDDNKDVISSPNAKIINNACFVL